MHHLHETTSSHLPILMELLNKFKIKTVLEFGPGLYSTKLFIDNEKKLTSIEMESIAWFNFVSEELFKGKNKEIKILFDKNFDLNSLKDKKYDLVFVDGDDRIEPTKLAFQISNIVIVHDTQHQWSKEIKSPWDYQVVFNEFPIEYPSIGGMLAKNPWTTLYTNRIDVFEYFNNISEEYLYEKYKFPYIYKEVPIIFPKEKI